ncbi:hypothetical protein M758_3G059200 [Ceratodon purpureus]|nr:hypothetical protein M758_3G059200 [Ceratodon purpureus]
MGWGDRQAHLMRLSPLLSFSFSFSPPLLLFEEEPVFECFSSLLSLSSLVLRSGVIWQRPCCHVHRNSVKPQFAPSRLTPLSPLSLLPYPTCPGPHAQAQAQLLETTRIFFFQDYHERRGEEARRREERRGAKRRREKGREEGERYEMMSITIMDAEHHHCQTISLLLLLSFHFSF